MAINIFLYLPIRNVKPHIISILENCNNIFSSVYFPISAEHTHAIENKEVIRFITRFQCDFHTLPVPYKDTCQ